MEKLLLLDFDTFKVDCLIYHHPCLDGFCSSWVFHHFCQYKKKDESSITYIKATHGDNPPDVSDKYVIIVDFSYPKEILLKMKEKAKNLIVLDHHISAQKQLEDLPFCYFDNNRSGCGLLWDFLMTCNKEIRPSLVNYVEDNDLWKFKYSETKAYITYLKEIIPQTFEEYDKIYTIVGYFIEDMGKTIVNYVNKFVENICKDAFLTTYETKEKQYNIAIVNSSRFQSEIGAKLSETYDFAVVWYYKYETKKYIVSLRSKNVDVSVIAQKFGGGGHILASGFLSDKIPFSKD